MKKWLMVIRAPFLPLAVVLGFLGACIAWYESREIGATFDFNIGYAVLAGVGILLAHISVDVLNEYFDFRSGVDLRTQRTPFSGGSGALPAGLVTPRQALYLGTGTLVAIVPLGIFFVLDMGWALLPLLLVAAALIVLYTPFILKMGWPEWAPGVGLGSLPILGAYFVHAGAFPLPIIIASIPSGILVHNLLLINEFPDVEADMTARRRTMPIAFGKRRASLVYSVLTVLVYLWIIGGVISSVMPPFSLLGLLTIPWAVKAIRGALNYQDMNRLVPAMASNVFVVLLTQLFMGIGYILAGVV
jgi:1,4-dihydroxy-2-naphthoate octaprenyltransferase